MKKISSPVRIERENMMGLIIAAISISFFTILAYFPSLHYPFQFDDLANITRHFDIRHNSLRSLFFSGTRWISYWLNSIYYHFGKFNPLLYRMGNIAIHLSNGLLVLCIIFFVLNRRAAKSFFRTHALTIATLTSLLFLLHPVQTQTVSYVIQGQLEGLAALASLAMIQLFLLLTATSVPLQRRLLMLALFAVGALSCGTKEITIVAPLLIALVDWFFIAQGSWRLFKTRLYLHASLSAFVICIYTYFLKPSFFITIFGLNHYVKNNIGNIITHDATQLISPLAFFLSQFKVIIHYLWMFLWPFNISVEYDWKVVASPFAPDCIVPLLTIAGLCYAIARLLRKDATNPIAFGALWFAICMAPRCTIMPSPELLVDYKTYLSSVGWLFILAVSLTHLAIFMREYANAHLGNKPLIGTTTKRMMPYLLVIPLTIATMSRNTVWENGINFWGDVIKHAPQKARAYNNYGVDLSQHGQYVDAIPYFQKAISIDDNYADPHNNLAISYAQIGQFDNAIETIMNSLKINPYYPEGYNNLASFLMSKQDLPKAKIALANALKMRPHYGKALFNLGRIYLFENNMPLAWENFKKCCMEADLDQDIIGFAHYGKLSLITEHYQDALIAYSKLLQLDPTHLEGKLGIAATYLGLKNHAQAIIAYDQILQIHPNSIPALHGIGECYFVTNQAQKALNAFLKSKAIQVHNPSYLLARIAVCYESLGNIVEARNALNELLSYNLPAETALTIAQSRDALTQRYQLT